MTARACWIAVLVVAASGAITAQDRPAAQSPDEWRRYWQQGVQHTTAWDLYVSLKKAARGGRAPASMAALPDWTGLWTVGGGSGFFAPGPGGTAPKVTAAASRALAEGEAQLAKGVEYDENLSQCGPPGYPRWLVIPFLREFIVRPEQTWLSSETVNNVRRIYTDGRDHIPEDDRVPLYYGDSIGFWDGPKLVIHTNQLMARSMGRGQPDQSDAMETVEIWERTAPGTITAHVWLYDPAVYAEPWYVRRLYSRVPNADRQLRMNYWFCGENPNNDVFKTPDGSTQFKDFTFTPGDDGKATPAR